MLARLFALLAVIFAAHPLHTRAQDRSGVRPEVLSVPGGPGSVEGLGAEFEPNPNTGTSSYSIPVPVPPAIHGFAPTIGLHYSSGSGNGELGLGWSLGLPSIQVSTHAGLPRYDASDTFSLTGMGGRGGEELVRHSNGFYGYRIEGAFVRVERRSDGSWEVRSRDGIRFRFGTTAESLVSDGGRVFAWYLTEQEDTLGNRISYEWSRDSTGRPYLDRVAYNESAPAVLGEITFEWEARPDALVSYVSGFPVATARRLKSVLTRHAGHRVRKISLSYDESSGLSRVVSATMFGVDDSLSLPTLTIAYANLVQSAMSVVSMSSAPARALGTTSELDDVDGDSLPDLLITDPALDGGTYSYYPNLDGASFGPRQVMSNTPSVWLTTTDVQLADMDGDGAADIVARVSSAVDGFRFYPGGDPSTFGSQQTISPNLSAGFEDPNTRLVDLDRDRLTDWLSIDPSTGVVHASFNQGNGVFSPANSLPSIDPNEVVSFAAGARLSDFNGDGLQDICLFRSASFRCWPATGRGRFDASVSIAGAPALPSSEVAEVEVRDVNGDGLSDLVHVGISQARIWLNLGATSISANPIVIPGTPYRGPNCTVRFADMNGNGSDDVVWVDPTNAAPWRYLDLLSTGSPGLIVRVDNGLGRVVSIDYSGIGEMRGLARVLGDAWSLRSPIGQFVLRSIETDDGIGPISRASYRYVDGYYSALAREFRGFARAVVTSEGNTPAETLVQRTTFDVGRTAESTKGMVIRASREDGSGGLFDVVTNTNEVRQVSSDALGTPIFASFVTAEQRETWERGTSPLLTSVARDYDDFGNEISVVESGRADVVEDSRTTSARFAIDTQNWLISRAYERTLTDANGTIVSRSRTYFDGPQGEGLPLGTIELGQVSRTTSFQGGVEQTVAKFSHDARGNLIESVDARGLITRVSYDAAGLFPLTESQIDGTTSLTWSATFEGSVGTLATLRDPNGHSTEVEVDGLWRPASLRYSDDADAPTTSFSYTFGNPVSSSAIRTRLKDGRVREERRLFDGLGRERARAHITDQGTWRVVGLRHFDVRGQVAFEYDTFLSSAPTIFPRPGTLPLTRTTYDAIARRVRRDHQVGGFETWSYRPFEDEYADRNDNDASGPNAGSTLVHRRDGLGRPTELLRRDGVSSIATHLEFDVLDRLVGAVDPAGRRRSYTYDEGSNVVAVNDPDTGTTTFVRNLAGDKLESTDANGTHLRWEYDAFGRVQRELAGASGSERVVSEYHYDAPSRSHRSLTNTAGELAYVVDELGTAYFGYDERGRRSRMIRRWNDGSEDSTWTTFDTDGSVLERGFPDNTFVRFENDIEGRTSAAGPFARVSGRDERANPTGLEFGNQVQEAFDYDASGRVARVRSSAPGESAPFRDTQIDYDVGGRFSRLVDMRAGHSEANAAFSYSNQDRLIHAAYPDATYDYVYDDIGRMLLASGTRSGTPFATAYEYTESNRELPTRVDSRDIRHDAAGRITQFGGLTVDWGDTGMMRRVSRGEQSTAYMYSFDGVRGGRHVSRSDGTSHDWLRIDVDCVWRDGVLEKEIHLGDAIVARVQSRPGSAPRAAIATNGARALAFPVLFIISAFTLLSVRLRRLRGHRFALATFVILGAACGDGVSQPIEMREVPAGTRFLHRDELGRNVFATSDAGGNVDSTSRYSPFGVRESSSPSGDAEPRGYLQREIDATSGAVELDARLYSPEDALLYSADPVLSGGPDGLGQLELGHTAYGYGSGDPINRVDPSGAYDLVPDSEVLGGGGGGVGGGGVGSLPALPPVVSVPVVPRLGVSASVAPNIGITAARTPFVGAGPGAGPGTDASPPPQGDLADRNRRRQEQMVTVYATYTIALSDGSVYSGRTSIRVRRDSVAAGIEAAIVVQAAEDVAQEAVRRRFSRHHIAVRAVGVPALDEFRIAQNEAERIRYYNAIRGREQILIDHHGGAQSEGGTSGNSIRGVARGRIEEGMYRSAAIQEFGWMTNNNPADRRP